MIVKVMPDPRDADESDFEALILAISVERQCRS
ncbi:MAG: hypothetical protein ACI87E_001351 [Mariniblastus sp.]|jgi:hypothetical protein